MVNDSTRGWSDYELLDSGDGQRLERFGAHTLARPDPTAIWKPTAVGRWKMVDARFSRDGWEYHRQSLEAGWQIGWGKACFVVRPTPFRHVGLFPEQNLNWTWLQERLNGVTDAHVLNLFAYTGAASVVAAQAGATVCHVDASKPSLRWAQENARLSGVGRIRWIEEDAIKFMAREVRRGKTYDVITMDPPVFGRGPKGEIFRLEERLSELLALTAQLLSKRPLGFLLNFYATSLYPDAVLRLAQETLGDRLELSLHSLNLLEKSNDKPLPTGFFLRS
jgi:23S rRNA (cytosine1962-C5)-methyltransferase